MAKATIRNADTPKKAGEESPEDVVECLFNPSEYSISKSNSWIPHEDKGADLPKLEFGSGSAQTLSMELFLDTSTTGGDVRERINKLKAFMNVNKNLTDSASNKGRPPRVIFSWGGNWTFAAVITSLNQSFTLFRDDGVPVRATVRVEFLQAEESQLRPQNPTTAGKAGYKQYVVSEGDTIDWIAFREYGDASMWRYVADTNGLDEPGRLRPGQVLSIAPPY